MMKIAVVFSAIIVVVLGACESPKPIKSFDRKQYAGIWRHHVVVGKPILPANPCLTLDFTGDSKYSIVVSSKASSGNIETISGQEVSSDGGVLKFNVAGKNLTYTVLDTDYKTYGSVYVCDEADENGVIGVHLRSTKPDPGLLSAKLDAAQKLLSKPVSPRTDSDFSNC